MGKGYVDFIDYQKAFDRVNRECLWACLRVKGLSRKMWNIIRSMYESVLCCIRDGYYYTDSFESPAGVNQGCLLSPKLFCLFINEVTEELRNDWRHRYKCVMCARVLSSSPYQLNACDWLNYLLSASFGLSFAPIVLDFVWSNKKQSVKMS